jgi:hypothetical protein
MEYFQWGHIKELVHAVSSRNIEGLMARLQEAVAKVDARMLMNVE